MTWRIRYEFGGKQGAERGHDTYVFRLEAETGEAAGARSLLRGRKTSEYLYDVARLAATPKDLLAARSAEDFSGLLAGAQT